MNIIYAREESLGAQRCVPTNLVRARLGKGACASRSLRRDRGGQCSYAANSSLDHLVSTDEKRLWHTQTKRFSGLEIVTSSNFVGRSTGKSPGFAPLRILSTRDAARSKFSRHTCPFRRTHKGFVPLTKLRPINGAEALSITPLPRRRAAGAIAGR
jgi:hypothetical protein